MDPTMKARRFSAALRPIAAGMNITIPPELANNPEYLQLSIYERLAADPEFLAMLAERFKGKAGTIPDTAPPTPPHVIHKQWQIPPEPAKA
jgi:hypothetical protein